MRQTVLPGLDGSRARDPGLVVRGPSGRFAALLEQNRRLLQRVARKRRALERLHDELREHGTRAAARLEPLTDQLRALDAEIHQLFADLLKSRKLSKHDRREVKVVYQLLQVDEVISPRPDPDDGGPRARGREVDDDGPPPGSVDDLPSAARPSDADGKGTLRELFLRLAHALHPDRAAESADAGARTEAMKDVNRAYREGDLARLLEIERTWAVARVVGSAQDGRDSRDGLDRRARELERTNQALAAQLKALEREHRELARSDLARLAGGPRAGGHALDDLVREAQAEVARMGQLRDHVKAFRNGEISAEGFFLGTEAGDGGGMSGLTMEEALDFMAGWTDSPAPPPPRRRGKGAPARKRRQRAR